MQAPPELTPEKVQEVKYWLIASGILVFLTWLPIVLSWIHERKKRKH